VTMSLGLFGEFYGEVTFGNVHTHQIAWASPPTSVVVAQVVSAAAAATSWPATTMSHR
jgi:hypothetical protein